jgi:GAF domain-containing protein
MTDRSDIADALARAAREINAPPDLARTLDAIVHTAQRSLPGIDHVGISVAQRDGRTETKAGTGQLVWDLDQLQYDLGEGPCWEAITADPVVRVDDLRHEQRWPKYIPHAVSHGLRAQLGLRLYVDDRTLGALNLYCTTADAIDPDVEHLAELFAVHAALALGRSRREQALNIALETRTVIGQAVGIIMERYDVDEDRAFEYLTRVSQHSNVKIRDVAQALVSQHDHRDE